MRNTHVWNLLALHVPNVLPKTVFGFHTPYLRRAGRLIWSIVIFTIGLIAAVLVIRRPKRSNEPATWSATILGAMYVWVMFALGYAVIPHEWLTFANSYLNFDSSTFLLKRDQWATHLPPFQITRDKVVDTGAVLIYVVMLTLNVALFVAWQKRKVAEPATEEHEATEETPITGGGMFSRLRRRDKRTSAYGRPVTTSDA
jgi:hypothetical protein